MPFHEFFHLTYNPNMKFIFIYAVLFLVVLLVLYIKHRLTRMPIGRAWEALREDEIACRPWASIMCWLSFRPLRWARQRPGLRACSLPPIRVL